VKHTGTLQSSSRQRERERISKSLTSFTWQPEKRGLESPLFLL
jgi:hypothetical protein